MQQQDHYATLIFRVEALERELTGLKGQLQLYEPARENDLKLQRINDAVGRIEGEVIKVKEKLEGMNIHQIEHEKEERVRFDRFQIRSLWFLASSFILAVLATMVNYVSHLFSGH